MERSTNSVEGSYLSASQTQFDYDQTGRLTNIQHEHLAGSAAYAFQYDEASRITNFGSSSHGGRDYGYDLAGQLVGVDGAVVEVFDYDAAGNRVWAGQDPPATEVDTYTIGPHNRLLADEFHSYEYDDEGNVTAKVATASGIRTEYEWDHRNRLVEIRYSDAMGGDTGNAIARVEYDYNADDRRIEKRVFPWETPSPSGVEQYVYDGDELTLVLDGNGVLQHRYLYGPLTDQLLADELFGMDGTVERLSLPLADHQNSTRLVLDATQEIRQEIDYDAFGRVRSLADAEGNLLTNDEGQPDLAALDTVFTFCRSRMGR